MFKNITKPLVLAALLNQSVSAVEYPEVEGHCPYKPGELKSNVSSTLNAHRITGRWMNVYDRESLNDNHKCYGVKFMHTHNYDDHNISVEDEDGMKDVPKLLEYLKATNVGESKDTQNIPSYDEDGEVEADLDGEQMLSYGYKIFNGFQLDFSHPTDLSVAYLKHRDIDLANHTDEDVKEHGHDDKKEDYYNEHMFDSQFPRYAQVLDTDYEKYLVMYQCFETARYYNKETGQRIPGFEAWEHATSSSLNFNSWPMTQYHFGDKIDVRPRHFENVKILFRPEQKQEVSFEDQELPPNEELSDADKAEYENYPAAMEYRFPDQYDTQEMHEMVHNLKTMIQEKHTSISFDEYGLLDHVDGRCDYDPYDRYDAGWQDEADSFGHLRSESVDDDDSTPETGYVEEPAEENAEELSNPEVDEDTGIEGEVTPEGDFEQEF